MGDMLIVQTPIVYDTKPRQFGNIIANIGY